MKRFLVILTFLFFVGFYLHSNTIYIRSGAEGNNTGLDWKNALVDLPKRNDWVRGNTYYIADGTYHGGTLGYYVCSTPETGNTYIIIKKATEKDHGADNLNWSSDYGNGVAEFPTYIDFRTSYWIFDGVKGFDDGIIEPYGFRFYNTSHTKEGYLMSIRGGVQFVTIQHVEMAQAGVGYNIKQTCFDATDSSPSHATDWTLRYTYMHDVVQVHMLVRGGARALVEHNYMARRSDGIYDIHGEAISWNDAGTDANIHIRYNKTLDIEGTGIFVIKDSVQSHFYIYGNLFVNTRNDYAHGNGAICNTGGDTNTHMYVFNNTFIGINGSAGVSWYNGANNYTYNNIWYNCEGILFRGNTVHDYNSFYNCQVSAGSEPHIDIRSGNPFINLENHDYRLAASTANGLDLSTYNSLDPGISTFDIDIHGKERVLWNRGAFELGSPPNPKDDNMYNNIRKINCYGLRIKQ